MKCKWWSCTNEARTNYCSRACGDKYRADRHRREVKLRLVLRAGGACVQCGYKRCIFALEFHHRDPSQKAFGLGSGNSYSYEKQCAEADKCDLLCANCHREREAQPFLSRWEETQRNVILGS